MSDDQTPSDETTLREATPGEDRLIRYLSRVIGGALMQAWQQTPAEFKDGAQGLTLTALAALAHNMGQLLAAAPSDERPATDAEWKAFVETTLEMVRDAAIQARAQRLEPTQTGPRQLIAAQPKFTM